MPIRRNNQSPITDILNQRYRKADQTRNIRKREDAKDILDTLDNRRKEYRETKRREKLRKDAIRKSLSDRDPRKNIVKPKGVGFSPYVETEDPIPENAVYFGDKVVKFGDKIVIT